MGLGVFIIVIIGLGVFTIQSRRKRAAAREEKIQRFKEVLTMPEEEFQEWKNNVTNSSQNTDEQ